MYKVTVEINIDNGYDCMVAGVRSYSTFMEAKKEYKELCTIFDKQGYTVMLTMNRGNRLIEIGRYEGKMNG